MQEDTQHPNLRLKAPEKLLSLQEGVLLAISCCGQISVALLSPIPKELLNNCVSTGNHCPALPLGSLCVEEIMIGRAEEFKWNRNRIFFLCVCGAYISQ